MSQASLYATAIRDDLFQSFQPFQPFQPSEKEKFGSISVQLYKPVHVE